MYFIVSKDGTKAFYLFENQEYIIGRKDCSILIKDDTSISRKHASLSVKKGKISITDLGAKYNTFVNTRQLKPNMITELNINDEIKFGILNSFYIVKELPLTTTTSGLTPEEKKVLSKVIKRLDGIILEQWSKQCSYLTVREIMLTLKVLCALIERQPIVTQDFWTALLKNVNQALPPPNPNDYKAGYAENVLNKNINLSEELSRKTLFKNKIFVFKSKSSRAKINAIIELAGGTSICWDGQLSCKDFLSNNPQYLLIQDDATDFNTDTSFMKMISYLHSIGKRSIPFQEIAMAIVSASCEKDCNPDFDRAGMLIKGREEIVFTTNFLAPGTQTQDFENEEKPSITVPETAKEPHSIPTEFIEVKETSELVSSNKREGQVLGNEVKRIRLENSQEKGSYSNVFFGDIADNVITSTQKECSNDIDVKPSHHSVAVINDTNELSEINNESSNKAPSVSDFNHKRSGQEVSKDTKRKKVDENASKMGWVMTSKAKANGEFNSVDLTIDDDILTSTQRGKNSAPSTSKQDTSMKTSENPFGSLRCGTSKSNTTSRISELFKSSPVPSQRSSDVSTVELDTSSTAKRKSNTSSSSPNKKQMLFLNPASMKISKTKQLGGNQNLFPRTSIKEAIAKDNPFTPAVRKTNKSTKEKHSEKAKKEISSPYVFNVTVVDKTLEDTHMWISRDTVIKNETGVSKNMLPLDENMQSFLESFNNCVIVEKKSLVVERPLVNNNNETVLNGRRNFKRFRKVEPLHVQTTIVPKSRYCNSVNSEVMVQ